MSSPGELHRPEQVEALIEQAANTLDTLDVRECPKLAKYLRNRAPGLALAQASLLPKLEALGEHYWELHMKVDRLLGSLGFLLRLPRQALA